MLINLIKSKIHRVTITQADVDYIGSITIDPILMKAANLIAGEKVQVLNIANGERLETYVIEGNERGQIGINGPAALKMNIGDVVILMDKEEAQTYKPTIAFQMKKHLMN